MYEKSIQPFVLKEVIKLYPSILPDYKIIIQNSSISSFIQDNDHQNTDLAQFESDILLDIDTQIY